MHRGAGHRPVTAGHGAVGQPGAAAQRALREFQHDHPCCSSRCVPKLFVLQPGETMATFTVTSATCSTSPSCRSSCSPGEQSFKHDLRNHRRHPSGRAAALLQSRELQLAAQLLTACRVGPHRGLRAGRPAVAAFIQGAQGALQRANCSQRGVLGLRARAHVKRPRRCCTAASRRHRPRCRPGDGDAGRRHGNAVAGVAPVEATARATTALIVPADVAAKLPPESTFSVVLAHGRANPGQDRTGPRLRASANSRHPLATRNCSC